MKNLIRKIIPDFLISWYHFKLAFWGAVFYGFPSRKLKVIGVTGTGGKSTVVDLTARILEDAGYKAASLSSIKFKIGKKEWLNDLKMTMPGRFKIQKFLRQAVNSGCQYAVLEVTSEGIKQHRHRFIDFGTAVFTNLTPEHIERHGSFEKYREAKGKLFQKTKNTHIINLDDESAEYFMGFQAEKKIGFMIENPNAQNPIPNQAPIPNDQILIAQDCQTLSQGIKFSVNNIDFNLKLLGEFNIYNTLAAICVGLSQGVSLETCKTALEKVKGIPGRMEIVVREPFTVVVDYAHTPDSLESVYKTLSNPKSEILNSKQIQNSNVQNSKLICVLGSAGGGRDKWKRPEMGKIAAQYCDEIILTNEDPYDENPLKIMEEIEKGFSQISKSKIQMSNQIQMTKFQKILDRREAIKKALELARAGDTVIITGKGCEPWMCVEKGKKIPWDDRKIVREEFDKL